MNRIRLLCKLSGVVIGLLSASCTHYQKDPAGTPSPEYWILQEHNPMDPTLLPELRIQARVLMTHRSGKQDVFTLIAQFEPSPARLELWLMNDFGTVSCHVKRVVGELPVFSANRSAFSNRDLDQLLLQPLTESMLVAVLFQQDAIPLPLQSCIASNHRGEPSECSYLQGRTVRHIRMKDWTTTPSGRIFPALLEFEAESAFFTRVNLLDIKDR